MFNEEGLYGIEEVMTKKKYFSMKAEGYTVEVMGNIEEYDGDTIVTVVYREL